MSPPAHNLDWRKRWERLTEALEHEFFTPDPDSDRIADIAVRRQRLLMDEAPPPKEFTETDRETLRIWLESMLEREQVLRTRAEQVHTDLLGYMQSFTAGGHLRDRLPKESQQPVLLDNEI